MKLVLRVSFTAALLVCGAIAQRAGDMPPALVWDRLKGHCPVSLDWASLRGRAVVVSLADDVVFPDDVADWSALPEKFQGQPVIFVRVVGGSEFLLDQALKKTPYQGCIVFDSQLANRRNFNLPRYPRTVVVDDRGWIAGYCRGDPDEETLRSVLNREPADGLSQTPPQPQPFDPAAGLDPAPSYEVHIAPAAKGEWRVLGQGGSDRYIAKNAPLNGIILDLWDTPLARISFPENLDKGNYDVSADIPVKDPELLLKLVREAVERRFGLSIEKEEGPQRVYVLTATHNSSPQLKPAKDGGVVMSGNGQWSIVGTAQTMQDVANAFQGLLNVPVIDETGLKGKYDYSAFSKRTEPESAFDMAHQLALELTETERPVEMLVVRKLQ